MNRQITLQDNINESLMEEVLGEMLNEKGEFTLPFLHLEGVSYYANGWSLNIVDTDLPLNQEEIDGQKFLSDRFFAFMEFAELYKEYEEYSLFAMWNGRDSFYIAITAYDCDTFNIFEIKKEKITD